MKNYYFISFSYVNVPISTKKYFLMLLGMRLHPDHPKIWYARAKDIYFFLIEL